jgi:hypothetical protein
MTNTTILRPIRESLGEDVRPVLDGAVEVGALYEQFRKVFAAENRYRLFACPVPSGRADGGRAIRWMSDVAGEVRAFDAMDAAEQQDLLLRARSWMGALHRLVEDSPTLPDQDRKMLLRALEKAFEIPGTASVYEVGGNPVLTEWGFVHSAWNAPRRVLRVLFDERLAPEGTGELTVLVRDGEAPVASTWVEAEMAGQPDRRGVTDATGAVRFNTLPLDSVLTLRAVHDPAGGGAPLASGTIRLSAANPRQTLTLSRTRRLTLRMVDAGGVGLAGVTAQIRGLDAAGVAVVTVEAASDAAGEIMLPTIPPEVVTLKGQARPAPGDARLVEEQPVELALTAGCDSYDIVIAAAPARPPSWRPRRVAAAAVAAGVLLVAGLAGLWLSCQLPWGPAQCWGDFRLAVVDAANRTPIAGAELVVSDRGTEIGKRVTDSTGGATIPRQAQGASLAVAATAANYTAVALPAVACCRAQPMVVELHRVVAELRVEVVDAVTRAPVAGAALVVREGAGGPERGNAATDPAGRADFTGQPQGIPLVVSAAAPNYTPVTAPPVICCGGKPLVVELRRAVADLRVTVVDSVTRAPIPGADVSLREGVGGPARKATAAAGQASFSSQPQGLPLLLSATAPGYDPGPVQTVTCCGAPPVVLPLKRTLIDLRVSVVDAATGVPIPGAEVTLRDRADGPLHGKVATDNAGQAGFSGQSQGAMLTVSAVAPGYGPAVAPTVSCCDSQPVVVKLTRMPIQVKVIDGASGAALAGATLKYQAPGGPMVKRTDQAGLSAVTEFTFGATGKIRVERRGYNTVEVAVTCCAADATIVKLDQRTIVKNKTWEGRTSGIRVAAVLEPGDKNFVLRINDISEDDDIQLFSASGKHLAGTSLTDRVWVEHHSIKSIEDFNVKVFNQNILEFDVNPVYDNSKLNNGGNKFSTTNLNFAKFNRMEIGYSGDGNDKGFHEEVLKISLVTEKLIIFVVGAGSFEYMVDYESAQEN